MVLQADHKAAPHARRRHAASAWVLSRQSAEAASALVVIEQSAEAWLLQDFAVAVKMQACSLSLGSVQTEC